MDVYNYCLVGWKHGVKYTISVISFMGAYFKSRLEDRLRELTRRRHHYQITVIGLGLIGSHLGDPRVFRWSV